MRKQLNIRQGEPAFGCTEFTWPNGLKVVLQEDRSRPVVEVLVVYKVGSRNEGLGVTGIAHLLEHMMFKGTKKFNPDKGNSLDIMLAPIGASTNANTWYDRTIYHELVPSSYLELVLKLESDRMRNLRLRQADLDSEMTVVRNELEQRENYAGGAMRQAMYATAFQAHPYRHDTIGWVSDVEGMPVSALSDFYNLHYWPNNATLVVSGDFDSLETLYLIDKYFGKIARSPQDLPKVYTVEPEQKGERRFKLGLAGNVRMVSMGFHTPSTSHADIYALNMLSSILGSSYQPDSRLYKELFETGLVSRVYASCDELKDPGLFTVSADVGADASTDAVEQAVRREIERLQTELVSDEELSAIKIANRKGTVLVRADAARMAFTLGGAEAHSTWRWLVDYDDKFDAVTAEDVQRVARTYFQEKNRTVGILVPEQEQVEAEIVVDAAEDATAGGAAAAAGKKPQRRVRKSRAKRPVELEKLPITRTNFAPRIVQKVLPNGLTVVALPFEGSGAAAVNVYVKTGNYLDPRDAVNLSDIVADMLPMGSEDLNKSQLASQLRLLGVTGSLRPWVRPGKTVMGEMVPSGDVPQLLKLLAHVLRHPTFNQVDLETIKRQMRASYQHGKNSPGSVAATALTRVAYAPDALYFVPSHDELTQHLDRMDVAALRGFHTRTYVPSATVVAVVGDIDVEAAVRHVEQAFGDWIGGPAIALPDDAPVLLAPRTVRIPMVDKSSVDIALGHPGDLDVNDADYDAATLGNAIFGGDTMLGRLGSRLRVEEGLTYGVYSSFWDSFRGAPFSISLSVNPANVDKAVGLTRSIWREFLDGGITQAELDREAGRAIGTFQLRLASFWGVAHELSEYAARGIDLASMDDYAVKMSAITVDQVNAAIRRHMHPDNASLAMAGTFAS